MVYGKSQIIHMETFIVIGIVILAAIGITYGLYRNASGKSE
ncbi:MAG: hypothetical protein QGH62_02655 [Nitrospinaceae bacterium]|nr:hypothetical protein [Nitrospinaceae bacterium]